jgi:hypothetical protein
MCIIIDGVKWRRVILMMMTALPMVARARIEIIDRDDY